jgi:ATP-dependent protease ClpP protease subunit
MDYGDVRMLNATTLFFDGYVEKYTINRALDQLKRINKNINAMEHDYPSLKGTLTPTVIINSNGGSVIEGLRFHDAIKSNKYPVTTIVSGIAASMGIIISSAGAVKKATKNSVLMIHSISAGAHGKYSQLMDYAKF